MVNPHVCSSVDAAGEGVEEGETLKEKALGFF